jgi:hypothetical protein
MRSSKYKAVKTTVDGITFDSKQEARRYGILRLMEKGGLISKLMTQQTYKLEVNGQLICKYKSDFNYIENGKQIVEDSKGFKTRDYILKKKLMKAIYGIEIRETK